jgi:hypothetical protein
MRYKKLNKYGKVNFTFIARYPAAIFAAGGILCILIGQTTWAVVLIGLAVILHIMWLKG